MVAPSRRRRKPKAPEWYHGPSNWTESMKPDGGLYVVMARAKGDPVSTRKARSLGGDGSKLGGDAVKRRMQREKDATPYRRPLLEAFAHHGPCTWNAVCVHDHNKHADFFFGTIYEVALWDLVRLGAVEHQLDVPILFRVRGGFARASRLLAALEAGVVS